jgi:hypothetical protein
MALSSQDQAFLDFAERSRPLLAGCALLMTGEPARARRLAQSALARRYPPRRTPAELLTASLQDLVRPQPSLFRPPWAREPGLQLVDATAGRGLPPLLGELQRLVPEQRASLVFGQYGGMTAPAVAEALGTDVPTVEQWVRQAYQILAVGHPDRLHPGRLAEELRAVADNHLESDGPDAADEARADLQHAHQLVRNRRVRTASALVAAGLVVVIGAVTFLHRGATTPEAASTAPPAVSSPTASPVPHVSASCDVRNGICQATVMRQWRTEMSRVAASYVDPDGTYFTGYSFSYTPRYESRTFWAGRGGALGLEISRLQGGATEVYVQVASDYRSAVPCGEITGRPCQSQRFMDGNRFTLTTTTQVSKGIEVQYRPEGDQVITVVARNRTRGTALEVTRAELLALVQDPRLRLPEI